MSFLENLRKKLEEKKAGAEVSEGEHVASTKDAAMLLGCNTAEIHQLTREGALHYGTDSKGQKSYAMSDLMELVERRKAFPMPERKPMKRPITGYNLSTFSKMTEPITAQLTRVLRDGMKQPIMLPRAEFDKSMAVQFEKYVLETVGYGRFEVRLIGKNKKSCSWVIDLPDPKSGFETPLPPPVYPSPPPPIYPSPFGASPWAQTQHGPIYARPTGYAPYQPAHGEALSELRLQLDTELLRLRFEVERLRLQIKVEELESQLIDAQVARKSHLCPTTKE